MADGPTPPPEEDLAHSSFTVNWGGVGGMAEVPCQIGGFKIIKHDIFFLCMMKCAEVPQCEEVCYCHCECSRFLDNDYFR